jgi:MATE family multidrug resistance protein
MIAIALPMVVSNACDTAMTFTDRLFLSRLGPEQMNASMSGGLTSFMMMTFFIGLTGYSTALVAQYLGAKRKKNCCVAVTQALIISILAYPIILAARPLAHWFFEAMHIAPEQLASQKVYFNILLYAVIIGLVRNCLSGFFSGIGRTRIVMISTFVAMVVNIGMNYLLIYGKCGFPAMGIRGAAYGTILGGLFGLLVLVAAYLNKANREEFDLLHSLRFNASAMKKLLRFGYPAGLEFFLNMMAFNLLIMTFHSQGSVVATAITVVFNWDMVSFVPLIGVNIGVVSLVGRYMGARQPDIAHRATMSGLKLALMYSMLTFTAFLCFPELLVKVFRPEEIGSVFSQAEPMAIFMVRMASIYVCADATMIVFSGALRGAGDTFWAMCISVGVHWGIVAILNIMLRVMKLPAKTTWGILVFLFLAFTAVFFLRYRTGKWRTIEVVQPEAAAVAMAHGEDFHEPSDM